MAEAGGVPLKVRIWCGCGQAPWPGDALAIVYDPNERLPLRGAETGVGMPRPLRDLAPWGAALVAGSLVAVVRSYWLSSPCGTPNSSGKGGVVRR